MPNNPIPQSRKTVRQRSILLVFLFLLAASISYPAPANWVLQQVKNIAGVNLGQISKPFVLGLDLQGGTHLEYEADLSKVTATERTDALSGVRDVIERRVNTLGVSEPLIQTTQAGNSWRVTVELAGIKDIHDAIKLIGETPILEFKEQGDSTQRALTPEETKQMNDQNAAAKKTATTALADARQPGADFAKLSTDRSNVDAVKTAGGELGWIKDNADAADLYQQVKTVAAGTIVDHVVERTHSYDVVQVEEAKNVGTEVLAHHLLISYSGAQGSSSTSTKEEAKAKIDALKKIATPQNFDALVAANSDEPGAKESKGNLNWFGKGEMVSEFETVVFPQAKGTISDVVETPFGYHLIYKIDERPQTDVRVRVIELKKVISTDIVPAPEPWKETALTGKQLKTARVDFDQRTGVIQVSLQFDSEGTKLFGEITKRNVGKPVAIFLDGQIISQPTVQTEILGGNAVITGNFSIEEAKTLAQRLNAGALPVPIKLIAQQTVGPELGADSLQKSLKAGLAGFALVALFMILLYRLPGLISIIALCLYAVVSAAFFKLIPVTLTLAGIAGFILSIGIAVDANVLVYERLKEEWREGKDLVRALEDAFRRAWPSIRDGHVTVLISCAVLYWFSSSIIRGFALTLAIGTLVSLFTAIVSCRTFLRLISQTPIAKNGWLFLKPKA